MDAQDCLARLIVAGVSPLDCLLLQRLIGLCLSDRLLVVTADDWHRKPAREAQPDVACDSRVFSERLLVIHGSFSERLLVLTGLTEPPDLPASDEYLRRPLR